MTDLAGATDEIDSSGAPERRRSVGVVVLAVLLVVAVAALGTRMWITSSTGETCRGIGIGRAGRDRSSTRTRCSSRAQRTPAGGARGLVVERRQLLRLELVAGS